MPHVPLQLQLDGRPRDPVPPGEVRITWLAPARWGLLRLSRPAVEAAARVMTTAAAQEVRHTGFGTHILVRGLGDAHVVLGVRRQGRAACRRVL